MNYALPALKHFEIAKDKLEAVYVKLICYLGNRESLSLFRFSCGHPHWVRRERSLFSTLSFADLLVKAGPGLSDVCNL